MFDPVRSAAADVNLPDRQVSRSPYQGVKFYEGDEPQFSLTVVRAPGLFESSDGANFVAGNDISFEVKYNCARWSWSPSCCSCGCRFELSE